MKDKIFFECVGCKKAFPFRTLELSIATLVLMLTLYEPFCSLQGFQSTVTIAEPARDTSREIQSFEVTNNTTLRINMTGMVIHPWFPAVTSSHVKPLLREAVLLAIIQGVGVPMIGKFRTQLLVGIRFLIPLQRRIRHVVLSRKLLLSLQNMFTAPKIMQFVQKNFRLVWKFLLSGYSKTNASKIVNRCKKYLHNFLHSRHDIDDDNHHHRNSSSHGNQLLKSIATDGITRR